MNSRQRVANALMGNKVDRLPVTALYNMLYFQDHFAELTGLPQWQLHQWLYSTPEEYLYTYLNMIGQVPFEILQPELAPPYQAREYVRFFTRDGKHYLEDQSSGEIKALDSVSGHARDYTANETQFIFTEKDARELIKIDKAEDLIASGENDYIKAVVEALGKDHFVLSGGVVGPIYGSGKYVGQTNSLAMLVDQPYLMDHLCAKITEQNIENIRAWAAAGGDAIYIDDATATSDMVSVKVYERFSLPYMKMMVDEIHRLGHVAIILYFGGVSDRLEQIASTGADGLSVETTMKNYINDIDSIADRIGKRISLFGNIDPVRVLQDGSDTDLQIEINRQAQAGFRCRGFLMCTGSPITPGTPSNRVRRFLSLGGKICH
jgi:uroporphyrinogen-III decarboxylase